MTVALPFLGVIVIVTLQGPAFSVFTPVPDTLHTFAYVDAIFRAYLPPEGTVVFASFNRVVFDALPPLFTTFDTVAVVPVPVPVGAAVVGVGAAVVVDEVVDDVVEDDEELDEDEDELDEEEEDDPGAARVTATV